MGRVALGVATVGDDGSTDGTKKEVYCLVSMGLFINVDFSLIRFSHPDFHMGLTGNHHIPVTHLLNY